MSTITIRANAIARRFGGDRPLPALIWKSGRGRLSRSLVSTGQANRL
jgi:hypothetical protein